jgi:thiol-disulfide isomerase/thioredoxin
MAIRSTYKVYTVIAFLVLVSCSKRLELRAITADQLLATIAQSQGENAVLVNFWATWCVPCVEEFPMIVDLDQKYADAGLRTYFVSVDFVDDRDRVMEFLRTSGVKSLSFIKDQKDLPFINGIDRNWSGALPFTMVMGRMSGDMLASWEGMAEEEKFEDAVQAALAN